MARDVTPDLACLRIRGLATLVRYGSHEGPEYKSRHHSSVYRKDLQGWEAGVWVLCGVDAAAAGMTTYCRVMTAVMPRVLTSWQETVEVADKDRDQPDQILSTQCAPIT